MNTSGLFRLANASLGDTLKLAKDGNYWAAFHKADCGSKFVKLQQAGPISTTTNTVMPINPATMMMAVALASVEKKLDGIMKMQEQILSFLERDKEAEIEADMETLVGMMTTYKFNWDNSSYLASNHKMVLDIKRTARKNIIFYQKAAQEQANNEGLVTTQAQLNSDLKKLRDCFQYYRLSIYIYALASLLEAMLSGNFKEENLSGILNQINQQADSYVKLFEMCSSRLGRSSEKSIEGLLTKGLGITVKGLGELIHSIPVLSDGNADEYLLDIGSQIEEKAKVLEGQYVEEFASLRSPNLDSITDQLQTMRCVFNKTTGIYFDAETLYFSQAK